MSALEWLDGVRADLDEATPWPWAVKSGTYALYIESPIDDETCSPVGEVYGGSPVSETDAHLIASAPDRLDRMEKALRGVMERHVPVTMVADVVDGHEVLYTVCRGCFSDWPCPDVTTIKGALGDE